MGAAWDWAGTGIENTGISVFASAFESVFLSKSAIMLSFAVHHSMLLLPDQVRSHFCCVMLCCFPLTFWLLILAFRDGCVVSLNTNMNTFYHQNFPRSLVNFSWKLLSGWVFAFLFLLSSGGAACSSVVQRLCYVAVGKCSVSCAAREAGKSW